MFLAKVCWKGKCDILKRWVVTQLCRWGVAVSTGGSTRESEEQKGDPEPTNGAGIDAARRSRVEHTLGAKQKRKLLVLGIEPKSSGLYHMRKDPSV